jgi:hypothetical protein
VAAAGRLRPSAIAPVGTFYADGLFALVMTSRVDKAVGAGPDKPVVHG